MKKNKILIVGAGLCGTLLAMRMAQRGHQVELVEKRQDMRKENIDAGRSINLALSKRGLKALRLVGIEEEIKEVCIPMLGRMIHAETGETWLSKYSGREGEHINSVSRGGLNIALLNHADDFDSVNIRFNLKCTSVDLEKAIGYFKDRETGEDVKIEADIVIGTDGAGSAVRRSMMGQTTQLLFNYSQHFLRHGYKELSIPPGPEGEHLIEKNALHIWPHGSFMVIALPNLDGSFTVTMFHPFEGKAGFNSLRTKRQVLDFFEQYYPNILPLAPNLLNEYFDNPTGTLGTIKCYPWQAYGKTLLMGDASHAIVPFYGQGMNAAFEDVVVFDEILNQYEGQWERAFMEFQDARVHNTNAIADLAIDNFYEMRDHVDDPAFIRKRKLEMQLEHTYPEYYSKYSLVTFNENISYSEAMKKGRLQDEILLELCKDEKITEMPLMQVLDKVKKESIHWRRK